MNIHWLKSRNMALPVVIFVSVCAVTFAVLSASNRSRHGGIQQKSLSTRNAVRYAKRSEIPGLPEGEVVSFPVLRSMDGKVVNLTESAKPYLLLGFISTLCPGCSEDVDQWMEMRKRASERDADFYLVNVQSDRERVDRFAKAYGFDELPVLYDPDGQVSERFKISFVPQYIVISREGKVLRRWNGIMNTSPGKVDGGKEMENKITELLSVAGGK